MDFALTEEQQLIRSTAADFLADLANPQAVRQAMESGAGYPPDLWPRICSEMGWQAMIIPEACGGLGLGGVELAVVMEQMGRHLLCSPFFATTCIATQVLLELADPRHEERLAAIAAGEQTATLAFQEAGGGLNPESIQATARDQDGQFLLSGVKHHVIDGHCADLILIAAREPGSRGEQGISLFAVPADTPKLARRRLPAMDQSRPQAALNLDGLRLPRESLVGEWGLAGPGLARSLDRGLIALAAEQTGGAAWCLEQSVSYTQGRVQFGRPIASFQAVKHKCADMMLLVESARSATFHAACVANGEVDGDLAAGQALAQAAALARIYCSDAYFRCAGEALQLHGGVGFTWEYDVHLHFKRAHGSRVLLGDPDWHRERLARLLRWDAPCG